MSRKNIIIIMQQKVDAETSAQVIIKGGKLTRSTTAVAEMVDIAIRKIERRKKVDITIRRKRRKKKSIFVRRMSLQKSMREFAEIITAKFIPK